jgi:hypothetical protein
MLERAPNCVCGCSFGQPSPWCAALADRPLSSRRGSTCRCFAKLPDASGPGVVRGEGEQTLVQVVHRLVRVVVVDHVPHVLDAGVDVGLYRRGGAQRLGGPSWTQGSAAVRIVLPPAIAPAYCQNCPGCPTSDVAIDLQACVCRGAVAGSDPAAAWRRERSPLCGSRVVPVPHVSIAVSPVRV